MPPPPHGSDFLESLKDLFTEAGEDGRDPQENFLALRDPLISYVQNGLHMTKAKARASLQLSFTDGIKPETVPQLPPRYLTLDEEAAGRLSGACSGNEFIGMLRTLIDEKMVEEQLQKRAKRKRKTKAESAEAKDSKKPKISVVLKARPSPGSSPGWGSLKKKVVPGFMKQIAPPQFPLRENEDSDLIDGEASESEKYCHSEKYCDSEKHSDSVDVSTDNEMGDVLTFLCSDLEPRRSSSRRAATFPKRMAPDSTISPASCDYISCAESQHNAMDAEAKEEPGARASPEFGEEQFYLTPTKRGNNIDEESLASVGQLANEISTIDSSEWETYKPKLLEALTKLNINVMPNIDQPVDTMQSDPKGLEEALVLLKDETSRIPTETWQAYEAELMKFSTSQNLRTMKFQDRLHRISRILFLPEEEEAIVTNDWERLEGVVRICTMLAQITGPIDETLDEEVVDGWAVSKLRDIDWFRKSFGIKERVSKLTAASMVG